LFLLISLAFTYSRASYLAFALGAVYLGFYVKQIKKLLLPVLGLLILVLFLPTARNPVSKFTRSFSVLSRIENYQETLKVFKVSPVVGVGFNNMCLARQIYIGPESFSSHSCSGSDSSLLLVLATTGVAGFFVFINLIFNIWKASSLILKSSLIALFTHSLFSNSMFYPWIMGWILILLATHLGRKSEG
jgi:O-antigen ligase